MTAPTEMPTPCQLKLVAVSVPARETRPWRQQRHDGEVLEQQDGEGALAIGRVQVAPVLQDLHGEGGGGQRQAEARHQRALPAEQARVESHERQNRAGQQHLRTAEAENILAA
jgi:hypothetical protein